MSRLGKETEKGFREAVLQLAKLRGWLCYFTWSSINSPAGFPDLVMVRNGKVIFAELKSEKGRLSEAQKVWAEELKKAGNYYLLRPSDWTMIDTILL